MSLIFDLSDTTLLSPVPSIRYCQNRSDGRVPLFSGVVPQSGVCGLELLNGHISELIYRQLVRVTLSVVHFDGVVVLLEDVETVHGLVQTDVGTVVLHLELLEGYVGFVLFLS